MLYTAHAKPVRPGRLRRPTREFYQRTLQLLLAAGVPYLVGGGVAFSRYTGIARPPKDFDLFMRRDDCVRALELLAREGYRTELRFPHWLGKAWSGHDHIDFIFSSGNGISTVDDAWFEHSRDARVFGCPVHLVPPEEMIWSKAFIMERERFDGADIAHLLQACGGQLDWPRLLRRFEPHYRVLLTHLLLFGFAYPEDRACIPDSVLDALLGRLEAERAEDRIRGGTHVADQHALRRCSAPVCRGTLISREQYLVDIEQRGYRDARLPPEGSLTEHEVATWTADIRH